jgi:hypothetical protein
MRLFKFFLSHSLLIAVCSAGLTYQSMLLLGLPIHTQLLCLVFFSTLAGYNFYWILAQQYAVQLISLKPFLSTLWSYLMLLLLSAIAIVWILIQLPAMIPWVGMAVVLTIVYSVPLWPLPKKRFIEKAGFIKTLLLAFTWTFVTVGFPVRVGMVKVDGLVWMLCLLRWVFILLLAIIFDTRDIAIDRMRAFHSLATDLAPQLMKIMVKILFLLYTLLLVGLTMGGMDVYQVISLALSGIALWVIYRMSLTKRGYYFYYFLVDGLMLFSTIASFVASI